ncbi:hypothetical protein L208DRAFT_1248652 [Tricholoma matsutake]|nr:hypothetical protein L208DRAFT_1248652 [Tricholoma matsutake 945]
MIDTYNIGVGYNQSSPITSSVPPSDLLKSAGYWSEAEKDISPQPSRSRKPRREKPRIDLAPDQPPTTQGKPRERVYVACLQCRTRKIRCDGAKPACHNCARRTTGNNECNYDPVPKRRGPDKTPGARQRLARDLKNEHASGGLVRRRRRQRETATLSGTTTEDYQTDSTAAECPPRSAGDPLSTLESPVSDNLHSPDGFLHSLPAETSSSLPMALKKPPAVSYTEGYDLSSIISLSSVAHSRELGGGFITQIGEDGTEAEEHPQAISNEPSLNFNRKVWWDSLLSLYISPASNHRPNLTTSQRESAILGITSDIRFVFRESNYWFSFFHISSFFGIYFDPVKRERMQPSLVLALLAISTFWQSSEVGLSSHGRERALRFRDEAQSALDASLNAGWIDETLAQAAWLLAMFEISAHPRHSTERAASAMMVLDSIIRSLSLTLLDADDPKTSIFTPGAVPGVPESPRNDSWASDNKLADFEPGMRSSLLHSRQSQSPAEPPSKGGCRCQSMTLKSSWPQGFEHVPFWALTPAWNCSSEAEIRKESCRRLCWSSLMLAAGHASYHTANRSSTLDLFISDPANYALLFSGESVASSPVMSSSHSSKDTIWALHDRSILLWHGCVRMRNDTRATNNVKAHFAMRAWLEGDNLECALNNHTCEIERAFIFQAREYLFNTRMFISHEFQRYVPLVTANVSGLFHRFKAEEWLNHQYTIAKRFMHGLHTITGHSNNVLARRPFFVFWFMSQISRALSLWECENTLIVAIDVCKALLPALDYLTALWPCPEQRYRYEGLRKRLDHACYIAGVTPPPNQTLPSPLSQVTLV